MRLSVLDQSTAAAGRNLDSSICETLALARRCDALDCVDEVAVLTTMHDPEVRRRGYALLADAASLAPEQVPLAAERAPRCLTEAGARRSRTLSPAFHAHAEWRIHLARTAVVVDQAAAAGSRAGLRQFQGGGLCRCDAARPLPSNWDDGCFIDVEHGKSLIPLSCREPDFREQKFGKTSISPLT